MKLNDIFEKTNSRWASYSAYDIIDCGGEPYVTSNIHAQIKDYDPLKSANEIVVDAINVGLLCVHQTRNQKPVQEAILDFCAKYGLLGFMTALTTTPDFWEYEAVYFPKNPVIKSETMNVKDYMTIFFPAEKEEILNQKARAMSWFLGDLIPNSEPIIGVGDREIYKLMINFRDLPFAQRRGFQRGYAEPYEWLRNQFRDWASMFLSSTIYYEETDETMKELHRRAMNAVGGIAPHYRVVLTDSRPMIKWDFHSLLQTIQMILSFTLSDENRPLRLCPSCDKAFIAQDPRAVFCSRECKNRYGVRKSRNKPDTE